jgi:hypothetical protein
MSEQLPVGQQIKVHTPTTSGSIFDQNATVKGYEGDELLIRFDHQGYVVRLPLDWKFDLIPGEPVSHWQVWEVLQGDRLLKDGFETPLQAEFFVKQEKEEYHQVASRHDDWVPPPQFEIRAVPIESDRLRR